MLGMNTNLMGSAGNGARLDQGRIPKLLNGFEIGHGRFAVTRHLDHPLPTFEYILFDGFNDSIEDAHRLAKLVSTFPCKINLLAYNENSFSKLKRLSEDRVLAFQDVLSRYYITTTYRRSRGRDIAAACGQLKTEVANRSLRQ